MMPAPGLEANTPSIWPPDGLRSPEGDWVGSTFDAKYDSFMLWSSSAESWTLCFKDDDSKVMDGGNLVVLKRLVET